MKSSASMQLYNAAAVPAITARKRKPVESELEKAQIKEIASIAGPECLLKRIETAPLLRQTLEI